MALQSRNLLRYVKRVSLWALQAFGIFLLALHLYALSLKFLPVPGTLNMLLTEARGEVVQYQWTDIDVMSPNLIHAVIAAEDSRFCSHSGISISDIRKAINERAETGRVRGASTLSQQTAKNVFFWNGGGYVRKIGEAWMALFIDFIWGKERTLEVYLNVAEWGDGLYGAEAAAQGRFRKQTAEITPYEAALLAAVLPSPNRYRLDPPSAFVRGQARTYVARMEIVKRDALAACIVLAE